jgi:hypothetical protein
MSNRNSSFLFFPSTVRLCKTGRRRGQGWSAAQSASEPRPSLDDRSEPQAFHHHLGQGVRRRAQGKKLIPDSRPLIPVPSMPRLCAFADLFASGGADLPASAHSSRPAYGPEGSRSHSVPRHRACGSERRTAVSAVAIGGSSIMPAKGGGFPDSFSGKN